MTNPGTGENLTGCNHVSSAADSVPKIFAEPENRSRAYSESLSPLRAWASLLVLGCVGFLAYLDLQIFSVVLQQVKLDLRISDSQLGLLTGALTGVFAAVSSFPIGTLADRFDRRIVLACSVVVWSAATVVCGLAHSFSALSAGAIAMAVGESAFVAIIYGMVPELFGPSRRPLANTLIYTLLVLGVALALYTAGGSLGVVDQLRVSGSWPQWRLAFGWAGALGLPVCCLLLIVVPSRQRRLEVVARAGAASDGMLAYLLHQGPFVVSLLFWLATFRLAANALQFWMPTVLVRELGVSPHHAGIILGQASLLGTSLGVAAALILLPHFLHRLGNRVTPWIAATGCCAAGTAVICMTFTRSASSTLLLYGTVMAVATFTSAITPGLLQDVSRPHLRSRTIAIFTFVALAPRSLIYYGIGRSSEAAHGSDLRLSVAWICGGALIATAMAFASMAPAYKRLMVRLGHSIRPSR